MIKALYSLALAVLLILPFGALAHDVQVQTGEFQASKGRVRAQIMDAYDLADIAYNGPGPCRIIGIAAKSAIDEAVVRQFRVSESSPTWKAEFTEAFNYVDFAIELSQVCPVAKKASHSEAFRDLGFRSP